MKKGNFTSSIFVILFAVNSVIALAGVDNPIPSKPDSKLYFEENKNQWPSQVKYKVDIPGGNLFLENNTLTYLLAENVDFHSIRKKRTEPLTVHYHAWKVKFENSNPAPKISGVNAYSFVNNYYHGNDPSQWAENVKVFEKVKYENIYKNIDMAFYGSDEHLKYDFIIRPGGDYTTIKMSYDGADEMHIEQGHLYIKTSLGVILEQKPYAYQEVNGVKTEVPCNYFLDGNKISFTVMAERYNRSLPLIIDPTLIAATYTGSKSDNWGYTATYDAAGNIYTGGIAAAAGYPTTTGAFQKTFGGGNASTYPFDISLTKFNPTGTAIIFSTYYGGSDNEEPHSMFVNSNNELYVVGRTYSSNFPTTAGAYDKTYNGGADITVGKFNSTGGLLASTFLGGSGDDGVNYNSDFFTFGETKYNYADDGRSELILDNNSDVYVAASTQSPNFPTTAGAYSSTIKGIQDGCIFKMNNTLSSLVFSTFLGGSDYDAAYGLKLDNTGNICVTGGTTSNNFPTTAGVINPTYQGQIDGFISILNPTATSLLASTYIGTNQYDQSYLLEIDPNNNDIYVFGQTEGAYPVTAGVYSNPNSSQFIHKLNSSLTATLFSTVIGNGSKFPNISPTAFLVDSCQSIYLAGWGRTPLFGHPNSSPNATVGLPITANAIQSTTDGGDFYFMVLTPNAKKIWYGTFYGENSGMGNGEDHVDGGTCRFDRRGFIYESCCASCGGTSGFPTAPSAWAKNNGCSFNCNNAVIKMDMSVHPVAKANFTGPNKGCAPFAVPFNTTGSVGAEYIWNFGDGSPADTTRITSHTYSKIGTYTVTLYALDSLGVCVYKDSSKLVINVGTPPTLNTVHKDLLCHGASDGTATVTATGGLSPLSYAWTPTAQTTAIATGLSAATYSIVVKDSIGCVSKDTVTVNEPPPIKEGPIAPTNVTCFGSQDGIAVDSASGGSGAITYSWNTTPVQATPVASNLSAGNYTVTISDANGCTTSDSIKITEPPAMILANASVPSDCGLTDGSATLFPSGGLTPYTYLWLTTPNQVSATATGLASGSYTVFVIDAKGCNQAQTITIGQKSPPVANFSYTPNIVSNIDPAVYFKDESTGNPYWWSWNFGELVSADKDSSSLQNPTHVYADTGRYCITLIVFDSSKVCKDTIVKCLDVEAEFTFYIPNAFTPNSDGLNEVFFGYGTYIKTFHIMVFDRWGNLIFESNDIHQGWDGKVQKGMSNELVQEDVYVWKVDLTDLRGAEHNYIGHVTKVR